MKYVEFYKLNNDGAQNIVATCILTDQGVVCDGSEPLIENLRREGILDYSSQNRTKLFFQDGVKFLEQLQYNLKSGYLNASEIKEK